MQKKKPCKTCKKPKEIDLEPLQMEVILPTVYPINEIKLAYAELTSYGGVKEDKKDFIQDVYQSIFNEPFDFSCSSCVSKQARKFHRYITNELKIKV